MNIFLFFLLYNTTHHSNFFDGVVFWIAQYADTAMIVITFVAWILFFLHDKNWKQRRWVIGLKELGVIIFSTSITLAVIFILKKIVAAPRPFVTFTNVQPLVIESPYTSFPSGHAGLVFALATTVYMYHKRLGYFFFACAVLISLSRVFAGVHYPIDILSGGLIGILFAYLSSIFFSKNK